MSAEQWADKLPPVEPVIIYLSPRDYEKMMADLKKEPEPNEALVKMMRRARS